MERLIDIRKRRGYSQEQMAKMLEISRSTYSGYENGYFKPPIDIAIKIKKILKHSKDDIFLNTIDRKTDKMKGE